jgi:hypothetical protein
MILKVVKIFLNIDSSVFSKYFKEFLSIILKIRYSILNNTRVYYSHFV